MKPKRLIVNSLRYYWRSHLTVLLGVMTGTAVISGALLVGDSVRDSLKQMSLDRLGHVDHALPSYQFLPQRLASEIAENSDFQSRFESIAPALQMQSSIEFTSNKQTRRATHVQLFGIDERGWDLVEHGKSALPEDDDLILNQQLADQLDVAVGDEVSLWVEIPATIPRDSLLGKKDQATQEVVLTISAILPAKLGASRFALVPNQQSPLNAYISLERLQSALDLNRLRRSKGEPKGRPARVNLFLAQAKHQADQSGATAVEAAEQLTDLMAGTMTIADIGLRVAKNESHNYLSLESDHQILETALAEAGEKTAKELNVATSHVFVYLADKIVHPKKSDQFSRYSLIAGLDFSTTEPFGPWKLADGRTAGELADDEIILNDWLAEDVGVRVGETVLVDYKEVGPHGELPVEQIQFKVAGIVPLTDSHANDRGLTPEVKGITDVNSFDDWDAPFPMDPVTPRDDSYWEEYRATPKAFVSLKRAQQLWQSRYGQLTSVRIASSSDKSLEESAEEFEAVLVQQLKPADLGLAFMPVKHQGVEAAQGTTDFSGLFIAFSFFLIMAAVILMSLLFQLGMEKRAQQVGLLGAVGLPAKQIKRIFFVESTYVVLAGGILGSLLAVGYAGLMIHGLKTWWYGAIRTPYLNLSVQPKSLIIGFSISTLLSLWVIHRALKKFGQVSLRGLLAGNAENTLSNVQIGQRRRKSANIAIGSAIVVAGLLAASIFGLLPNAEAFSGFSWKIVAFFVVGSTALVGSLAAFDCWLNAKSSAMMAGSRSMRFTHLGIRNTKRQRQRSLWTVSLIASATFIIVAVASGQRNPAQESADKSSGNGGFLLVADSSQPILANLNSKTEPIRDELQSRLLTNDEQSARDVLQEKVAQRIAELREDFDENGLSADESNKRIESGLDETLKVATDELAQLDKTLDLKKEERQRAVDKMQVFSFRKQPGEEASCLNIYQTQLPTVLGVPPAMIKRGGFKFVGAKQENPWELLNVDCEQHTPEGGSPLPTYPVLGDMNTLQWSIKVPLGGHILGPNDEEPEYALKIVGMFDSSPFQGMLLMSTANFETVYPKRYGYEYFLIDVDAESKAEVSRILESGLAQYGFDVTNVADRLADFLAVQNTYLSTFQTLGALGLLLGTLGLATVMLRNVFERRSELALMRAVGFNPEQLASIVLTENVFLLCWGLASGAAAALLAMLPHLLSTGADVSWLSVSVILVSVFIIGTAAAIFAVREAIRTPILQTLRAE